MQNALRTGSWIRVKERKAAEIYPFLEAYIAKRLTRIREIEQVVERYERKRLAEERAYQSMTPLRRMLFGKKPDHHLAVEYIHYVKKPMEQARKLRTEVEAAQALLNGTKPSDVVQLPEEMERELM